jgi:hypothetical protein
MIPSENPSATPFSARLDRDKLIPSAVKRSDAFGFDVDPEVCRELQRERLVGRRVRADAAPFECGRTINRHSVPIPSTIQTTGTHMLWFVRVRFENSAIAPAIHAEPEPDHTA